MSLDHPITPPQFPVPMPWDSRPVGWLARYAYPSLVVALVISVAALSSVPLNLVVVSGGWGKTLAYLYASVIVYSMIRPSLQIHKIGSYLAVAFFFGRASGFIELMMHRDEWSLTAAVLARIVLGASIVVWHLAAGAWAAQLAGQPHVRSD